MIEISGDIVICDPALLDQNSVTDAEVLKNNTFNVGLEQYFLCVYPVEDYKEYYGDRESYLNARLKDAFNGAVSKTIGKTGTDRFKIGVYPASWLKSPSNKKYKVGSVFRVREFKGKIGHFYDKYGVIHLFSVGNYNFYTI